MFQSRMACVRPALRHIAHQRKRRLAGVVRHLHGENAALRQCLEQPRQHRRMVRHPLKHRVAEQEIRPSGGVQVVSSPCTNGRPGSRSRACRSMSDDESTPTTSASGNRSIKSSVELPGPQPRSNTRSARSSGTCASRSRDGRVRSSSNLRYWRADQSFIGVVNRKLNDACSSRDP